LDLSSAFDTVDHTSLLSILESRISIFGHRTVTGAVPLIYLTDCVQVFYYPVQSDFPDTTTIKYPPAGLRPWSNNVYQLYREYYPIFSTHTVQYHRFADDTQSYDLTSVSAVPSLLTHLSSCVADLANSYASLRLQLNPTKTEFILFGSRRNLVKLSDNCRGIIVGSSVIQCTNLVQD